MPIPILPITTCPDGSGSLNNPANTDNLSGGIGNTPTITKYVPPDLCIGNNDLTKTGDDAYQEQLAAENLTMSGATINIFKLLGVHEQGKLVDIIGNGFALNGSTSAFDALAGAWVSPQTGLDVLMAPAWIGYDFGIERTSYDQALNAPSIPAAQHVTSLKITQPSTGRRALQIRVDRATGSFKLGNILYTGIGNGTVQGFTPGTGVSPGTLILVADSPTTFIVFFTSDTTRVIGVCTVNVRFNALQGSFTVQSGAVPFVVGDTFSLPIVLDWYRVDVVNLPDTPAPALVRIIQSSPSRYWRIVPTSFSGATTAQPWEVEKLELFDYRATSLDDVQDALFLENRDRDYATASTPLKVAYQPFDAISDLSKFGFQMSDVYTFTTVYALMVRALGRPIVVGDVLELPSEVQYDHNLRPVRKFLEVTDASWAADGYTTQYRPITYRFQASQLIPSQEHRDLLGTVNTQKYTIDDSDFFNGLQQIQTGQLTSTEAVFEEALKATPEKGEQSREIASGTNIYRKPGSYDGTGLYVSDGLPPDGQPYTEGFKLPDVGTSTDRQFFRLNYDPNMKIASRLYMFSAIKNSWIWVETDRRAERNSHKPSQREIFERTETISLTAKSIT